MPSWAPELTVDERLARRLLADAFPDLPLRTLRPLAEGWDSTVFLVDDEWAFRFPRREVVLPGLEAEIAVLPLLAPQLPVAIPVPELVAPPSDAFPWPFAGARLIPGREATGAADRDALAPQLARALRALHAADVGELREDGNRRADMQRRVPYTRERLAELELPAPAFLGDAEELPPPRATAVCHGDLHFRHLIVDGDELRGLIDWIDVCRSDPSIDLQLYWSFFDPPARASFLAAYGRVDDATLLRARVVALFLNAVLLQYAEAKHYDEIAREARASLERTLSSS